MHTTKHTNESLQETISKYDSNLEYVPSDLFIYKNDKSRILVRVKDVNELKTDTIFNIRNRFYTRNRKMKKESGCNDV